MANALMNANSGSGFNANNLSSAAQAAGQFISSAGANSGSPYASSINAYDNTINQYLPTMKQNVQPYMDWGQNAMPAAFQAYEQQHNSYNEMGNALNKMADPRQFVDDITSKYQESPWAAFERKYGQQGINNSASASGLLGSGSLMRSASEYNQDLSSKDMQTYLNNVLGVNSQYISGLDTQGRGYGSLGNNYTGIGQMGLNASMHMNEIMSRIMQQQAEARGAAAYGEDAGNQMDEGSTIQSFANMVGPMGKLASNFLF